MSVLSARPCSASRPWFAPCASDGHDYPLRRCRWWPGNLVRQKSEAELSCPGEVRTQRRSCGHCKRLGVHVLLEPGRSIIGPAGVLLTRVIYRKQNDGKQFLIVDAAMNDLMRPSLYGAHHEIVPVVLGPRVAKNSAKLMSWDRSARAATSLLAIASCRRRQEGDLLAILDVGAYGMSLASNYNTRPRAAEVLVDGKRSPLIRKRESIADLMAPERYCRNPHLGSMVFNSCITAIFPIAFGASCPILAFHWRAHATQSI